MVVVNMTVKLKNTIGDELYDQLTEEQRELMSATAGVIEFENKIDIEEVYDHDHFVDFNKMVTFCLPQQYVSYHAKWYVVGMHKTIKVKKTNRS